MTKPPPLLSTIASPADLKKLPEDRLPQLAGELRQEIIETVARVGGHLAPSLGVVELTVALHYVFNTPDDKLIWDVGHQCYAHKLLTGRRGRFKSIRQHHGISGFPKRKESPYDTFDTGHSSTSISAGLGIACAKDLKADRHKVIAVIGDGSMTGGMAFEALNQTGHLGRDLIVILNDNEMSISPNVGALSSFLSRKMTGATVTRLRKEMENFLKSFSPLGENILQMLKKSEGSFKGFFTPGMLFEALKFDYVGPIPGHDLPALIATLRNVNQFCDGPTLVHVITTKGKGYPPAEQHPDDYHGLGPFDLITGRPQPAPPGPPTYTAVFGQTLTQMAAVDQRIVAITAAMPAGTGLVNFAAQFPERFFDVGIAEQHAVTFAAGLATEGMRPVVAIYSTFLQRSLDQIIHDVCLPNLPVTLALDRAGLVGDDGPTHHGGFDLSYLRMIPNLVVMAPKDEDELRHLLHTALSHPGPAAIRYPRGQGTGAELAGPPRVIAIGKGEVLKEGDEVLLLPVGNLVSAALKAGEILAREGVRAAVLNPRFVKPLDEELILTWAAKTGHMVTVEENVRQGGFGSAVLELCAARGLSVKATLLGLPDHFVEQGPQEILRREAGLDPAAIAQAALALLGRG